MTPTRVGRYEIVRQIGRSMTDVYLAIDTVHHRKAALKLIPTRGDPHTRMVLEAERRGAHIQRNLRPLDPRVVEVYDVGEQDGYFYVAMQYVEGRDLAQVLEREHTLEALRAAAIALELCEQLSKFHTFPSSVVHGDIKPSNIHLGLNDTVRLLDFGIAKTLKADCDTTIANFGSPSYCSPERLSKAEMDQQSDLWAVGATLYQMLSGSPPYQAEDTRKLESLIRSKRPPRALPARCPGPLRAIAMKALAPNTAQRYRSAGEFQADLQAFLEGKPVRAELERRRWNATVTLGRKLRRYTRTVVKLQRELQWLSGAGWFLLGLGLWIGGSMYVQSRIPPAEILPLPPIVAPAAPVITKVVLAAAPEPVAAPKKKPANGVKGQGSGVKAKGARRYRRWR